MIRLLSCRASNPRGGCAGPYLRWRGRRGRGLEVVQDIRGPCVKIGQGPAALTRWKQGERWNGEQGEQGEQSNQSANTSVRPFVRWV